MINNDYEFDDIVPHPIDYCVTYLQAQHEETSMTHFLLLGNGTDLFFRRNSVKIRQQDDGSYRFTIRRVGKGDLFSIFSTSQVSGYLRYQAPNQTLISARGYSLGLFYYGLVAMLSFLIFLLAPSLQSLFIILLINIAIFAFITVYVQSNLNAMMKIIQQINSA